MKASAEAARVCIVAPGLRPALPAEVSVAAELPSLTTLLRRASHRPLAATGAAELIQQQFVSQTDPGRSAGAVALLGEGLDPGLDYWLRADPVHLRADQDKLLLLADTRPSEAEAKALASAFNRFYANDDYFLQTPHPQRWYLCLPEDPAVDTDPTSLVSGRHYDRHRAKGPGGRRWMALLNEVQMLFHAHSVNEAREQRGEPLINGVWCWGGGPLPITAKGRWHRVYSNEPLARGWARLAGIEAQALPERLEALEKDILVVFDEAEQAGITGDLGVWEAAMLRLEQQWLAPLLAELRAGRLKSLSLHTDGACWELQRVHLARFWRRRRCWQELLLGV